MKKLLTTLNSIALACAPAVTYANPLGGTVVSGQATIQQESPSTLVIQQSSNKAFIDWASFSIGEDEVTRFDQPGSSSVSVNRVTGGDPSKILGTLQANGQVWLLNPNGIAFGQSAVVDVAGLVATTANMSADAFDNGNFTFDQAGLPKAEIINEGTITAQDGGLVALVAPRVENRGIITARLGKVALAAGETFTLDLYGDDLVTLAVDKNLDSTIASNIGAIEAAGGYVNLSAGQAKQALDNVVNMDGVIQADTLSNANGRIVLGNAGGTTKVNGTVTANGQETGSTGGSIDVLGELVALYENSSLQADGPAGGGQIRVGGEFQGGGDLPTARRTLVTAGADLSARSLADGDGGRVIIWADEITGFAGTINATGGPLSGDGGFVEVSGKETLIFSGEVDTSAPQGAMGTLLLDPANINITDGGPDADDAEVSDGSVLEADGGAGTFNISEQALEALAAGTNITLEATDNITIADLTDNNLTLTTTGLVTFKADSESNGTGDFIMNAGDTILTAGGDLNISGANVAIGSIDTSGGADGDITLTASIASTLNGNITTNDGNFFLNGPVILANNVTYDTGAGNGGINFNNSLTGDFIFAIDAGTGTIDLRDVDVDTLTFTSGGTLNLNSTILTDKAINFSPLGLVNLVGTTAVTAQDGTFADITFGASNNINGVFDLTLTGDTVTIDDIGNSTPIPSLTVTANTLTNVTGAIITTGGQTFNGDVSLGGNLSTTNSLVNITGNVAVPTSFNIDTGVGAGDITIGGTMDGGFIVGLSAGTGAVSVGGAVGGSTPLSQFSANGSTLSLTSGVITTGVQSYNAPISIGGTFSTVNNNISFLNPVTLAANTNLSTNTGAGDITFSNTVNGAFDLTANAGTGVTSFNAAVGGSTPLNNVNISGNSVAVSAMNATGSQLFTGNLSLNGDLTVSGGPINLTGPVTLLANSTLTSGGGASDNITIGGDVTGDFTLELVAGLGDLQFANVDIDTLALTSGDDVTFGGNITTDTAQNYTTVDALNTSGNVNFTANDGGTPADIILDAANILTAAGDVTFSGATISLFQMSGINQLSVTGATAVNVNNDLTTSGDITFNGGPVALGGNLTTSADNITFNNNITLAQAAVLDTGAGAGTVSIGGTINGAQNLTITAGSGDTIVTGDIGNTTPLTNLNITANNITLANVTTTNAQTYNGTILANGLLSGGQAVNMVGDTTLNGGVTTSNGDVTITGNVTLTGDSILQSGGTASDAITINGNINGDFDLNFAAGAADIAIGGNMDIDQWIITSGGDLSFGGTFETDKAMDFTNAGAINLTADTTFTANDGGSSPQDITMGSNNILAGGGFNVTFNGNNVNLYQVGDGAGGDLGSISVNATAFNLLGPVFTAGPQTYTSLDGLANDLTTQGADITLNTNLVLLNDVTLSTGSGPGDIIFGGPVDGNFNLTALTGTGNITTAGNFGSGTPLASLNLSGQDFVLEDVTTVGDQTFTGAVTANGTLASSGGNILFNSPVTLGDAVTISTDTTAGGDITFRDTLNGAFDLTLLGGTGNVNFERLVGGTDRLGVLTVNTAADAIFTEGARVTRFVETSGTGRTEFGNTPGLDSLQGIAISTPATITGRLVSTNVLLESSGSMDVTVVADRLVIGGAGSIINATIGGVQGREAARNIIFSSLAGGPHFVNGINVPASLDFRAPQTLQNTALPNQEGAQPITIRTDRAAKQELNPFSSTYQLVRDDTGLLDPTYRSGYLWEQFTPIASALLSDDI
jgi:filamentous hemagglutinin family protein